ncbi:Rqc2 family fibronectin-binding protein [Anaerotignum propionicum]|uniref:Rqc2 family fibronectin-binding protein n=1 Tax=Anaerotignum propionicum TaxID=28446 RepID=UPI002899D20D|nr:NFACT RNA binding domain-containing protein [Anaerotignum propionicum]
MALDGITAAAIVHELKTNLIGGRIDKIHQPAADEIRFSVRGTGVVHKILASANSSNPRIHFTETTRENPMTAPLFCMVLRKHIAGGKIIDICQPNFERIILLKIESANEMGDMTVKNLILEIMGKHSNLILTDENGRILDSIKRVSHEKSSVREVLPGKDYVLPPSQNKKNPLFAEQGDFLFSLALQAGQKLQDFIYKTYTGISPIMAGEICFRAALEPSDACQQITPDKGEALFYAFQAVMEDVKLANFTPKLYYHPNSNRVLDFGVIEMTEFKAFQQKIFPSISALLESFYQERDHASHIKQKAHDMRRLVSSNIERCVKKKEIQLKTRKDVADMESWRKKGELLTANIYAVPQGATTFRTTDFYDEAMCDIEISLDPTKTPAENAQKYFSRYNKAKRTLAALEIQEKQNDEELVYLESVLNALDNASDEADLGEIRTELAESGFVRRQAPKKGAPKAKKAKPLHFISSDGYEIYVGKSNLQNDELTLRFADSMDIWLHTKEIPGSHVIIRTNGTGTASDTALEEASNLAAFFSKAKNSSMVPVDYTQRKNVKKPNGAKPGMVIYLTNRTIYVTPDEEKVKSMQSNA